MLAIGLRAVFGCCTMGTIGVQASLLLHCMAMCEVLVFRGCFCAICQSEPDVLIEYTWVGN